MKSKIVLLAALVLAIVTDSVRAAEPRPLDLFNSRILPIFRSPRPASCIQCHPASVDLKNYILPSHETTFVSLRDQGLVNLDNPEQSKILTLIRMGEKDRDRGARLIHEKTRKAEFAAFAAWLKACAADPKLRSLPPLTESERARPPRPNEVIRHARKSRVVDSFVRTVWSQRMRCFPCHTPNDIDANNPRHQVALKNMKKFRAKYPGLLEKVDFFKKTPEATLEYLVEKSRNTPKGQIPLLDLKNPARSLLILKPLSKVPRKRADGTFEPASSVAPISHMGGMKMHKDDQSYKSFVTWITDYARVVGDRYASVEDLPEDNWYASRSIIRLMATPNAWKVGQPVQLFVHGFDTASGRFDSEPIAFTQGTVTPRHIVNGALFLLAPRKGRASIAWDRERATLPRGRYLVRVFVDSKRRLAKDASLMLGADDYVGQAEISRARWREGFRHAETIRSDALTRD